MLGMHAGDLIGTAIKRISAYIGTTRFSSYASCGSGLVLLSGVYNLREHISIHGRTCAARSPPNAWHDHTLEFITGQRLI